MKVKLNDDVLKQALVLHNQETMEQIPDIINTHNFSYRFEKKIRRIKLILILVKNEIIWGQNIY